MSVLVAKPAPDFTAPGAMPNGIIERLSVGPERQICGPFFSGPSILHLSVRPRSLHMTGA